MTTWLSVTTAARRLGVSRQAVHQRIAEHRLPTRVGLVGTEVRSADVARWAGERTDRMWRVNGEVTT